ncbi:hypothetical protein HanIR_Chr15g0768221 [Helianthus annuus]|nr:hypothetical protein HanIR_Chr15g0768221 [Helianthus annuus]
MVVEACVKSDCLFSFRKFKKECCMSNANANYFSKNAVERHNVEI